MVRATRLASAADTRWVESYPGKDIVRGYARWYGVDLLCAVIELRLLGVPITAEREEQARLTAAAQAARRAARRRQRELEAAVEEIDDNDLPGDLLPGLASSEGWDAAGAGPLDRW